MNKQTFGVIVTTRSFFPSHLVETARQEILSLLKKLGHNYVIVNESETNFGAVMTLGDAKVCAELFASRKKDITGIIVVLPNFGDELGVTEAIERAGLNVPILIQACSDEMEKLGMATRRDAFCGKISLCNNLRQRGIPFSLTSKHTCKIDSHDFEKDLTKFASICNVVTGLYGSRIAMLGARPNAFNTVRFSEKILQRYGISVQTVDLSEVMSAANQGDLFDEATITAKEAEITAYGKIPENIGKEKITKQAKLCLAMEKFVTDLECDASTVQCWDSLENNYGCAACLGMSMMGEKGKPSACESDVTGAVSMLIAQLAAGSPPALMDWNNNVDDDNSCITLHCSNFPKSFFGTNDIEISCLDVLGSVLGEENTFGACKAQVAEGPMTFLRVTTDDTNGRIIMYVGEGFFEKTHVPTKGGVAYCNIPYLQELMQFICMSGFEHHVCFVRGHVADIVYEAMTKYFRVEAYKHVLPRK